MNIIKRFNTLFRSRDYWLFYILAGMGSLAVALYYQYVLGDLPCIVCIQVRLWISLLVIVAVVGLLWRKTTVPIIITNWFVVLIAAGLCDRSYQLLGTERGFIFGDCGFSTGLPSWFAIDSWLPWLYQPETSCGYTPVLAFGVTMAEALIVLSVAFFIVSFCVALVSIFHPKE